MPDKTSVVIISQYLPPDISGGGTRAYNYAKCLAQRDYNVTVITAHPHLHSPVPKEYKRKTTVREKVDNINIIRVWVPSLLHTSAKKRIILHLSFILFSLIPLFSLKPDVIFASEPNLFSIIPAYIYSKLRGGKVVRVVDDLWPEIIYERGYVKSRILKKILNSLANFSYTYPRFILPLTQEAKEYIENAYHINPHKIIVLEHGVDTSIYHYQEKESSNFCLMYSGVLVESYDFDIIIEAAKRLQKKDIKFVIRGKGHLLSYLEEKKIKYNLDNLSFDTNIVPFDQLSGVLSKADVLIIPMKNEQTLNMSLPTKILEYQALGRPIICCSNGSPGKYVERTKSGIRVDYGDLSAFVEAILKLKNDPVLRKNLGYNGRIYVEENLTFEKIGKRLSDIVEQTLAS